ncbi:MAG: HD domain-containing protein [Chloroflexi bacterium]|nr:HD domain-containing protein [Chloroflexota bacterium]
MTDSGPEQSADRTQEDQPGKDDPLLAALRQAEMHYRQIYEAMHEQRDELARLQADADRTRSQRGAQELELDQLRRRVEHQKERADALFSALRDIHRALFTGNIYDLILKTCMTLTGATRGQYLTTTSGPDTAIRVRASVDIEVARGAEPSEFVASLCRAVLDSEQVSVQNELADTARSTDNVPALRNCIAAPVVLHANLNGVVLVADKATGDFAEQDAEVLLSIGSQAAVAIENTRLQREIQESYLSIISLLADAMAARNPQVHFDHDAASRQARAVAQRLGLSEYQQSSAYYASLLHDIGNIGVSDGVLNKPGPLMDAERELIRAHAQIGQDLLQHIPLLHGVAHIVRHHHERYDGSGYPDGLQGEAIPIEARIVAVVDAYGAMLTTRSYRPPLTREQAWLELKQGAGIQFDSRVVEAFLAELRSDDGQRRKNDHEHLALALPGVDRSRDS